jgi:hypothetical protein
MRAKDLHLLAKKCKTHRHSTTCWKYWKGPPEPRECRFDLDKKNVHPISFTDPDTGEITLKCLDGLVNHFNASILEAIRCNMDIKFIGSGPAAKAILYYITDYIMKSNLKTHVTLAAMETVVHKLEVYNPNEDNCTVRAKKMLQKCAHLMISHQELSAQQVCSYLMDFEDHFTSHEYRHLYWTNFESYIEKCDPSPECSRSSMADDTMTRTIHDQGDDMEGILDEQDEELELKPVEGTLDDDGVYVKQLQNDEIRISSDNLGNLVPKAAQLMDYLHRDEKFNNICTWDFMAQVDKVKKGKKNQKTRSANTGNENRHKDEIDDEDEPTDNTILEYEAEPCSPLSAEDILHSSAKMWPSGELQTGHYESCTHFQRVR